MSLRRGFAKKEWEKQYIWAPKCGNNSLIWEYVNNGDLLSNSNSNSNSNSHSETVPGYANPSRSKNDEKQWWLFERKFGSVAGKTRDGDGDGDVDDVR